MRKLSDADGIKVDKNFKIRFIGPIYTNQYGWESHLDVVDEVGNDEIGLEWLEEIYKEHGELPCVPHGICNREDFPSPAIRNPFYRRGYPTLTIEISLDEAREIESKKRGAFSLELTHTVTVPRNYLERYTIVVWEKVTQENFISFLRRDEKETMKRIQGGESSSLLDFNRKMINKRIRVGEIWLERKITRKGERQILADWIKAGMPADWGVSCG